jgi:peroxiredoxin (alkyl hydroperoxide reductase subunit C)
MAVQVNSPAPAFELSGVVGKEYRKIRLSDYQGKWVVLFFYPLDRRSSSSPGGRANSQR